MTEMDHATRLETALYEIFTSNLELIEQYKKSRLPEPLRQKYSPIDISQLTQISEDCRKDFKPQNLVDFIVKNPNSN
ncbi:MAG: hypothetical protein AABW88_00265 [Nanoarchaeota archaeon]